MNVEVSAGIDELKRQFTSAVFTVREDGSGGAYVVMDGVDLGARYAPSVTWLGFHVPAQYPYSDVYPVFMGDNVTRVDGTRFAAPVTAGHAFEGRPAFQISRRNGAAPSSGQKVTAKVLKILDFLGRLQ